MEPSTKPTKSPVLTCILGLAGAIIIVVIIIILLNLNSQKSKVNELASSFNALPSTGELSSSERADIEREIEKSIMDTISTSVSYKGEKGDKGDPGEQGLRGYSGAAGPQGVQGIQGVQGLQGVAGADGDSFWIESGGSVYVISYGAGIFSVGETGDMYLAGDIGLYGEDLYAAMLGDRLYTGNYYLTDSETFTSSLEALDIAVNGIATATPIWTDGGAITYLTSVTDSLAAGGTDGTSPLYFDETNELLTLTNTTAGSSFRVNDEASDTTPFVIDASGNVGIGVATPNNILQVYDLMNFNNTYYGTYIGYQAGKNIANYANNNVYLGYQSGYSSTSADDNVFIGYQAGYETTTYSNNVYIGSSVGRYLQYGNDNVFIGSNVASDSGVESVNSSVVIGSYAGNNLNGTNYNVIIGNYAGEYNTWGNSNTFVGAFSGNWNDTGYENTYIGLNAGMYSENGNGNTFVGVAAGESITDGNGNSAFGVSALNWNEASYNTAIGYSALYRNSTGQYNTALGYESGNGGTGAAFSNSVTLGYRAGYASTSGGNNIFIGYKAGDSNTTGSGNIVIGYDIDGLSATAANFLNIGGMIYGDLSANKYAGIGTTSPEFKLDVSGGLRIEGSNRLYFGGTGAGDTLGNIYHDGTDFVFSDTIKPTGYKSSDGTSGITNSSSYWFCTAADCSTKCQVNIKDGLIVGCT